MAAMLSYTSGKRGYVLNARQVEHTRTAEELAMPELTRQLQSKEISFFTWNVLPEKHLATRDHQIHTWKLELNTVGNTEQTVDTLFQTLSNSACTILVVGPSLSSQPVIIHWAPPDAKAEEKERSQEAAQGLTQHYEYLRQFKLVTAVSKSDIVDACKP